MRKVVLYVGGWLVLVLLIAGTLIVLRMVEPESTVGLASAAPPARTDVGLELTGRVVPVQSVELRFPGKGADDGTPVLEVAAHEGSVVKRGDVLARLDSRDLLLRVEAAEAVLAQARAEHAQIEATANQARLDDEAQTATLRSEADAAMLRANADASKLLADAAQARAEGRGSAATSLESAAQSLRRAAELLDANAQVYAEKQAAAIAAGDTARSSAIAAAQAKVQQAEAALKREQLALEAAELRSPIDGTVIDVNIDAGEVISLASPAIVVADVSTWQLEADPGANLSLADVPPGTPATISFSTLPDVVIPGKVAYVKTTVPSSPEQVGQAYSLIVTPDAVDPRVRWNMMATVALSVR